MVEIPASSVLLPVLLFGLLIGVVAGSILTAGSHTQAADDSSPPTSYSSSGSTCYDGPRDHAGWLHVVATGETWTTTLNATVVHPRGTEVDVDVFRRSTGTYEIAIRTSNTTQEKPLPEDCQAATTVNVATALAEPSVSVTVDGRTVRTVDQDETGAILYPLPNPIEADG